MAFGRSIKSMSGVKQPAPAPTPAPAPAPTARAFGNSGGIRGMGGVTRSVMQPRVAAPTAPANMRPRTQPAAYNASQQGAMNQFNQAMANASKMPAMRKGGAVNKKPGYAKGGMVMANCGASMKPQQKAKK